MISIIIPVYNIEPYLADCIESILKSKNKDFEIILINDGSSDGSGYICNDYSKQYDFIKYIDLDKNCGVSIARNAGLDQAQGEWVCFIDGDDEIDKDFLTIPEEFQDCDVIEKPYHIFENGKNVGGRDINSTRVIKGNFKVQKYFKEYIKCYNRGNCNKIIKRDIIKDKRFPEGIKVGEDFLFFLDIFPQIDKYALDQHGDYLYKKRINSATTTEHDKKLIFERTKSNMMRINNLKESHHFLPIYDYIIYNLYLEILLGLSNINIVINDLEIKSKIKEFRTSNRKLFSAKQIYRFYKLYLTLRARK